jgi:predicted RNA-binding protein YlxR (DUF448 family)
MADDNRLPKASRAKTRTCVGCGSEEDRENMVRVIVGPAGELAADLAGGKFGRGGWLHPRPECVRKAAPRGLSRSFRTAVSADAETLTLLLRNAAEARARALIASAARARHVALGTTAVKDALNSGGVCLVVVAADARAAAATPWIEQAVTDGQAVAFGTKDVLGVATGRAELAVLAILDSGIATALAAAIAIAQMPMPPAGRGSSRVTEVG